ncbi:hypothetical protein EON67_05005 [archaeon]|nr:MAG: hypothetical protein EON67_05005 [archaeon]
MRPFSPARVLDWHEGSSCHSASLVPDPNTTSAACCLLPCCLLPVPPSQQPACYQSARLPPTALLFLARFHSPAPALLRASVGVCAHAEPCYPGRVRAACMPALIMQRCRSRVCVYCSSAACSTHGALWMPVRVCVHANTDWYVHTHKRTHIPNTSPHPMPTTPCNTAQPPPLQWFRRPAPHASSLASDHALPAARPSRWPTRPRGRVAVECEMRAAAGRRMMPIRALCALAPSPTHAATVHTAVTPPTACAG